MSIVSGTQTDHRLGFADLTEEVRVDALPLSGAGKVLKTRLREPFWQGRERAVA